MTEITADDNDELSQDIARGIIGAVQHIETSIYDYEFEDDNFVRIIIKPITRQQFEDDSI